MANSSSQTPNTHPLPEIDGNFQIGLESESVPVYVRIKRKHIAQLSANEEKLRSFFGVQLEPVRDDLCASVASFKVLPSVVDSCAKKDIEAVEGDSAAAQEPSNSSDDDLAKRVQVGHNLTWRWVEILCR